MNESQTVTGLPSGLGNLKNWFAIPIGVILTKTDNLDTFKFPRLGNYKAQKNARDSGSVSNASRILRQGLENQILSRVYFFVVLTCH